MHVCSKFTLYYRRAQMSVWVAEHSCTRLCLRQHNFYFKDGTKTKKAVGVTDLQQNLEGRAIQGLRCSRTASPLVSTWGERHWLPTLNAEGRGEAKAPGARLRAPSCAASASCAGIPSCDPQTSPFSHKIHQKERHCRYSIHTQDNARGASKPHLPNETSTHTSKYIRRLCYRVM